VQPGVAAIAQGYRLEHFSTLDSTNSEAMRRARDGAPGRLWLTAATQTAGRGRLARVWASPYGNLHASLLLVDEVKAQDAPQLGFVAGVALRRAVAAHVGDGAAIKLKWPNDLLAGRAKVAGILLEGAMMTDGAFACVVGFGVNCAAHPTDAPYAVTDLAALGAPAESADILTELSNAFAQWFETWRQPDGFCRVREAWLEGAAGLGERLEVRSGEGTMAGVFRTIDGAGRLVLEVEGRECAISAGDVTLDIAPAGGAGGTQQEWIGQTG